MDDGLETVGELVVDEAAFDAGAAMPGMLGGGDTFHGEAVRELTGWQVAMAPATRRAFWEALAWPWRVRGRVERRLGEVGIGGDLAWRRGEGRGGRC